MQMDGKTFYQQQMVFSPFRNAGQGGLPALIEFEQPKVSATGW